MATRNTTHLAGEFLVAGEIDRRGYPISITMGMEDDVASIPILSSVRLLGSGLIGTFGLRKRFSFKKLKSIFISCFTLCLAMNVQAELVNRGTDSLGNLLIYDSDLNITWYDYTHSAADASDQIQWASGLSVAFGGTVFSDWRLPATLPVSGNEYNYTFSYSGSTDYGFNISSPKSEMAYLYYMSLGNKAYYDASGNVQTGWGLKSTGPFTQLREGSYWSYNECSICPGGIWGFDFYGGGQGVYSEAGRNEFNLAIAVRDGDMDVIPIPSAFWLLGSGLIAFSGFRKKLGCRLP